MRDKDGISAAVIAAEMASSLREHGRSLRDELDLVARRWGAHASFQRSVTCKGATGAAAISSMMARLRRSPPPRVGDDEVVSVADYESLVRTDMRGQVTSPLNLPRSNVLAFELASGARIIARPSGTEPKTKFYFDVREQVRAGEPVSAAESRALAALRRLSNDFAGLWGEGIGDGT